MTSVVLLLAVVVVVAAHMSVSARISLCILAYGKLFVVVVSDV